MSETMMAIGEPVVAVLVLLGALLSVVSAFGLIRFPDMYLRSHAATKSTTLGVLFVLLGAFVYFAVFEGHVSARLLLGVVFVFVTAPVAGHLIGRAAYRSGVPLSERSVRDDLKPALREERQADDER